jgi:hypothetical protein
MLYYIQIERGSPSLDLTVEKKVKESKELVTYADPLAMI